MQNELLEKEIVDGKPHGGVWIGTYIYINVDLLPDLEECPTYQTCVDRLKHWLPKEFEHRHEQIIYRPAQHSFNPLSCRATVGIKAMVWGRAFKVHKFFSKTKKKYKKVYVSGRRKRVVKRFK